MITTIILTHPKVTLRNGEIEQIKVMMRNPTEQDLLNWNKKGYTIVKVIHNGK